jgi:fatty aldehyde-generating acyl-ACP reductase
MGYQPAGLDFALIGHQESWQRIVLLVNRIRSEEGMSGLSLSQMKQLYPFIPPRPLFELEVASLSGKVVKGVYIESFISPDECDASHLHSNIGKVRKACICAAGLGASIGALGGLTSIMLEAGESSFKQLGDSFFTTGNTLTSAFIVKGIENACQQTDRSLSVSRLLIIGSTGDIGSACVRYFTGKVKKILLHARRPGPLRVQAGVLRSSDQPVSYSTRLEDLLPEATIVICAASSLINCTATSLLPAHAIICDAGYPKNMGGGNAQRSLFFPGGLGYVKNGFNTNPPYYKDLYRFPEPNVVHGCLLEAIILAMEGRSAAYSSGRGNISIKAMENILQLAAGHGIEPAPLFNGNGYWEQAKQTDLYGYH